RYKIYSVSQNLTISLLLSFDSFTETARVTVNSVSWDYMAFVCSAHCIILLLNFRGNSHIGQF
ncbi:hypothetical protein, partial [Leptospira santarosai]|uniref:hypothetical protein n=1 Tax=Leptospira santarosai TaxID=28183 RepID=UPI0040356D45